MFHKLLCFLGKHDYIYKYNKNSAYPSWRYCPYCNRCENNMYINSEKYYRIEDYYPIKEKLEKIYNNS